MNYGKAILVDLTWLTPQTCEASPPLYPRSSQKISPVLVLVNELRKHIPSGNVCVQVMV
jgi:hypothetical protein